MQKRRERIERWRAERKKKELDSVKKDVRTTIMCKSYKCIKCNFNVLHLPGTLLGTCVLPYLRIQTVF